MPNPWSMQGDAPVALVPPKGSYGSDLYAIEHGVNAWNADNTSQLSNAISKAASQKRRLILPSGKLYVAGQLSIQSDVASTFAGIIVKGAGAGGSFDGFQKTTLIFTGTATPMLTMGCASTAATAPLTGVIFQDLKIEFTNAAFAGTMIRLWYLARCRFIRCFFSGPNNLGSLATLVDGEGLADVGFYDCWFADAAIGFTPVDLAFRRYANLVKFVRCWFDDIPDAVRFGVLPIEQSNAVVGSQINPDLSGATGRITAAKSSMVLEDLWFGDGNGNGTCILASSGRLAIDNCRVADGSIGVDVPNNSGVVTIRGGRIAGHSIGLRINNASVTAPVIVDGSEIEVLAAGGTGVDVLASTLVCLRDTTTRENGALAGTTGYHFRAGTKGLLRDKSTSGCDTKLVDDTAPGDWDITV